MPSDVTPTVGANHQPHAHIPSTSGSRTNQVCLIFVIGIPFVFLWSDETYSREGRSASCSGECGECFVSNNPPDVDLSVDGPQCVSFFGCLIGVRSVRRR